MKARSNTRLAVAALLIALVAMSVVLPAAAQAPRPMRHGSLPAPEGASSETIERVVRDSVRRADGRIEVIVTLAGQPAVEAYVAAGGKAARGSALSQASVREEALRAEQDLFASTAAGFGAEVVNSHTFLVNTVTLAVYPDQVARLWLIPGVISVTPNRIFEREDTTSVPLVRAPQVWDSAGLGLTGEGVVIGVIDTGIDYTHAHFGGPGDYDAAGDTTIVGDGTAGLFPAAAPAAAGDAKVIGGYDIVGDLFNPGEPGSVQTPDGDPVDCPVADGGGHGSHVAGTAAGWGVLANGDTYAGTLDASIFSSLPNVTTSFLIGPGVAPAASLVAIRVFGCEGATNTDVLLDAIEYTVTGDFPGTTGDVPGGVDVVNMSIGSGYGGSYDDDPLIAAQEAATDAGVIYVESAGNSGNVTLVTGAPGTTNSVISVASSTDTTAMADALLVRNNGTDSPVKYFAQPGAAHNAEDVPFTDDVVAASPLDGCTAISGVSGNIALIQRGSCDFVVKQNNAFAAGATGVIVFNSVAGGDGLISMSDDGINPAYDLPTYFIGLTSGTDLLDEITAAAPGFINVTFDFGDPEFYAPETADQISSFSSRGGVVRSIGDVTLKPNVSAPGNTIVSARSGTGTAFYVIGGTSMASPHVAGLAALLREHYPTRTVAEIKAMIMNTATRDVTGAVPAVIHPPQRVGSGRIDVLDAATTEVIAYWTENPENVALSFGYPKVLPGAVTTLTETITVKNFGAGAHTLGAVYESRSDMGGVDITVDPTVNVSAGGTATITVTLSIDPDANPTPNQLTYAVDTAISGATFLTEEAGNIVLTAAGQPDLHVPVYAAPHVASDMSSTLSINNTFTIPSIDLSGVGVDTSGGGALGTSIASIATAYELAADDGVDAAASFSPRPGDDFPQDDNPADIDKVGITSDALVRPNPANTIAYIAITTFKEWNRPAEVEYDIFIDEDHDGDADWILYNVGSTTNGFLVGVIDVNGVLTGNDPGDVEIYDYLNYFAGASVDLMLYKNNVMVFPFRVGLTLDGTFSYWIESYSQDADFAVLSDTVGSSSSPLYYDAFNPTFSFNDAGSVGGGAFTGLPFWYDWDGYGIPVDVHPSADVEDMPDILVIHHHNQDPATRAEVLDTSVFADSLGGFELLTPANNSVILDPADLTTVTWEDVGGTGVEWRFVLTQISTNTRLGQIIDLPGLTPEVDPVTPDPLTCASGVCTLDASGLPALEDGLYSWTATYTDGLNNEQEATNAPFFFTLETNDVNLLKNPGFEDCTAKEPANWNGLAICQLAPAKANSGDGVLVAAPGRFAVQKITSANSGVLAGQGAGDVLNFGGYFKGKAVANQVAVVTVRYASGPADKIKVNLTANTTGFELFEDTVTLDATPVFVKVRVGSATGKVFVDDLYLTTVGISGPETRAVGDLLPPPAAPDGFRGNN
jgi:subtilisin family serine protease